MKKIFKYLPDLFILLGICILSYNILRPNKKLNPFSDVFGGASYYYVDYSFNKVFGILLISIGVIMVIRGYIESKNKK